MRAHDIDEMLGTPARLAIVATVADDDCWTFTRLREATGLADGNLHVQARKLVDAGFLAAGKVRQKGREVTSFQLTATGRERFRAHIRRLRQALAQSPHSRNDDAEGSVRGTGSPGPAGRDDFQVW